MIDQLSSAMWHHTTRLRGENELPPSLNSDSRKYYNLYRCMNRSRRHRLTRSRFRYRRD